jgi:hypothetical protein
MRKRYSLGGVMLALICAGTACTIGAPSPIHPSGGPTSEPAVEISTVTDTLLVPPYVPSIARIYAVVQVPEGGTLNAYASAGGVGSAVGSLAWDAVDLHSTGKAASVEADVWVELNLTGGGTGWVPRKNLTEYVTSDAFCADPGPIALFPTVAMAVNASKGSALAALVSPVQGLSVGYIHGGTPRVYTSAEVASIFASTEAVAWGLGPGSGLPVKGAFLDLVRPDLMKVFSGGYDPYCDAIQLGGASYSVERPAQWKNFNYYSVYKPGPAGQEMDWMTWLVGMDYVDGLPYLFSFSRFTWEP